MLVVLGGGGEEEEEEEETKRLGGGGEGDMSGMGPLDCKPSPLQTNHESFFDALISLLRCFIVVPVLLLALLMLEFTFTR